MHIDIVVSNRNSIDNDIVREGYMSEREVDYKADLIMKKLGVGTTYREFYCKVVWKLPEATVNAHLEKAIAKGKDPAKYFTWLVKREGVV